MANAEATQQEDIDQTFQKRLVEERRRELDQIKSDGNVKAALRTPSMWAQLAANLQLKQFRVKKRQRRGRRARRHGSPDDALEVGWAATRGGGEALGSIIHDQKVELDGLRSQRVVQSKLRDPNTPESARKLFSKRRRHVYRRVKGANVLISKEGDEELSKLIKQRSQSFVEHLFRVPSRPKRVLNRLTTLELESIAAAELRQQRRRAEQARKEEVDKEFRRIGDTDQLESRQSKLQKQQAGTDRDWRREGGRKKKQLASEKGHQQRNSRNAIPHLMEKLISRENGGTIPDSAFTGTDSEQTPTASPVPMRKGSSQQLAATSSGRPGEASMDRHAPVATDSGQATCSAVSSFKGEQKVAMRSELPPTPSAASSAPPPPPPHHVARSPPPPSHAPSSTPPPPPPLHSLQQFSNSSQIAVSLAPLELECALLCSSPESIESKGNASEEFNGEEDSTSNSAFSSQVSSPSYPSSITATCSSSLEVLTYSPSEQSSSSGMCFEVRQEYLASAQNSISAVEFVSASSFSSSLKEQSSSDLSIGGTPLSDNGTASLLPSSSTGATPEHPLCYTPEMLSSPRKTEQTPSPAPYQTPHRVWEGRTRDVPPPKEAMSDPGFLTYLKKSSIKHPTREDYVTYHLNVFAEDVELKRGAELEQCMREMVVRAMKAELNYSSFYQVTHQLVKMAKDVQEKAVLIGVFGRQLCWKLPNLDEMIQEYTVQALEDMATDFLSLFPTMGIPWEDSEMVLQDEGWGEVFEAARSKGDVRENLIQILDSDSMDLELTVYTHHDTPSPNHGAYTIDRVNPIRPDHSHGPYPAHHGLSGKLTSKRQGPPLRRSRSVEVLISSSSSKNDNTHPFSRVGEEDTDGGERFRRSVTPSLVGHYQNHSRGADVFTSSLKQDSARPRTNSVTLQPPSVGPNQRRRFHSDSAPPPTQDRRRSSLQEVVAAIVPFMPAATVAIQVGVYAAIKALSN